MKLLRRSVAKHIDDRQTYYIYLEDGDDWLWDRFRTRCSCAVDEDDWDRALWERWVGEC